MFIGKFILVLSMSLFFVSCGDDEDDDDDQAESSIISTDSYSGSFNETVVDGEVVYRFPRLGDFLNDSNLSYYSFDYQCFQHVNDHGGKLIVQQRVDSVPQEHSLKKSAGGIIEVGNQDYQVPRRSAEGKFWGCYLNRGNFSKGVGCTGELSHEETYSDRWGGMLGYTKIDWECKLTSPNNRTMMLRYKQQVSCEGLLMRPPTSEQAESCQVRRWDYASDSYGKVSVQGEPALFDKDSHLGHIDGLDTWDSDCCQTGNNEERYNYREIYEASTMAMKKAMLAVWAESSLLWNP